VLSFPWIRRPQAYNLVLAVFGLGVVHAANARLMQWLLALIAVSFISDIVFLSLTGNQVFQLNGMVSGSDVIGGQVFSLVLTILNMFVKVAAVYFALQLFTFWGGAAAAAAPPMAPAPRNNAAAEPGHGGSGEDAFGTSNTGSGYGVPPSGGYSVPAGSGYAAEPTTVAGAPAAGGGPTGVESYQAY